MLSIILPAMEFGHGALSYDVYFFIFLSDQDPDFTSRMKDIYFDPGPGKLAEIGLAYVFG